MIKKPGRPSHAKISGCPAPSEVKSTRLMMGLSREAAAGLASVSLRSWVRWENGETPMHPDVWSAWQGAAAHGLKIPHSRSASDIASLRRAAMMTQEQLAQCLGVSVSTVSGWERGRAHVTDALFQRCCNAVAEALEARAQQVREISAQELPPQHWDCDRRCIGVAAPLDHLGG